MKDPLDPPIVSAGQPQEGQNGPEVVRRRGGRLDKRRDKAFVKRILDAILAGNTYANVAALAGVSERRFYSWMAEGRELDATGARASNIKLQFYQAVRAAEAKAVHRNVMIIQQAAQRDWRAAGFWLERRRKEDWGPQQRVEQVGVGGGPIEVKDVSPAPVLSKENILKLLAMLQGNGTTPEPTGA